MGIVVALVPDSLHDFAQAYAQVDWLPTAVGDDQATLSFSSSSDGHIDGAPFVFDSRVQRDLHEGEANGDAAVIQGIEPQPVVSADDSPDSNPGQADGTADPTGEEPEAPQDARRTVSSRGGTRSDVESSDNSGMITYVVQPGDALLRIADRYGVSASTIVSANDLSNPNRLAVGQQLLIPSTNGVFHTVQAGDDIAWIASRYGVTVQDIVTTNGLGSADAIRTGSRILIPSPSVTSDDSSSAASGPAATTTYTVQRGDTLLGIAYSLGVDADAIAAANELSAPYFLRDGRVLRLPADVTQKQDSGTTSPVSASTGVKHTVLNGDTIWGLSVSAGVSPDAIIAANGLTPPYLLQIGRDLVIPGSGPGGQDQPAAAPAATSTVQPPLPTSTPTSVPATPTAVPTPASSPEPSMGERIVDLAMQFRGYRYRWSGISPSSGFDCSGLVYYIYQQIGRPIPRTLEGQLAAGASVGRDDLQPGDIVFFANTYRPGLSHNGIYIGGGEYISAIDENVGVVVANMNSQYWSSRYYAASRP